MKSTQTEKAERLFTALGDLDPKTVASAAAYIPKNTRKGSNRPIILWREKIIGFLGIFGTRYRWT